MPLTLSVSNALMIALSGFVIVFFMLALLWGAIVVLSRLLGGVTPSPAVSASAPVRPSAPVSVPSPVPSPAPAAVQLIGVSEPEAACIMAIVSHETKIPLDELIFRSIRAK